jgi:hypothetical protein
MLLERLDALGLLCVVSAATFVTAGCGGAHHAPKTLPTSNRNASHTVRLRQSWTAQVLPTLTRRIEPNGTDTVTPVHRPDGRHGWWFVWSDPTRNRRAALLDVWTAEIVTRLYRDRRAGPAPDVSGIAIVTRAAFFSGFARGESTFEWPRPSRRYVQGDTRHLMDRVRDEATRLGLRVLVFRIPQLGGILAPVVALRVSNAARFGHWFDPGCLASWVLGYPKLHPRGGSGPSPFFGYFVTIEQASGAWLQSTAFAPYETYTQLSNKAAHRLRLEDKGLSVCPHAPQ